MANDTLITVIGNLTSDPNLRHTPSGTAVVDFTVASTPRTFDKASNQWKDGDTLLMRCSAWRDYAENIANSLTKGTRVIVQGRLVQRSWEKDGQQRTSMELQVEEVGPCLRYATAQVVRSQGGYGSQDTARGAFTTPTAQSPQPDPWAAQTATQGLTEKAPF